MTLQRRILILVCAAALLAAVGALAVVRASSRADEKNQARAGGPRITRGEVSLTPRRRRPADRVPEHGLGPAPRRARHRPGR
ncbi:hypothetical protein GCM10020254_13370 [Streptomyces goshikiensis]